MDPKILALYETLCTDPDFINLPRHGCSLKRVMERHPDGVPDALGAKALNMSEVDYREVVEGAVVKLRSRF